MKTISFKSNTVKLGYNELGYNEHPVITNKLNTFGWFRSFLGYISLRTKLGYNEQNLTKKPLKSWFLSYIYKKNMQEKPFYAKQSC